MKNIAILLILAAVGCTAVAPHIDVTRRTAHFDVAGADDALAREAEEAWRMLAEVLQIEPARATIVAVADQAAFDRAAPEAAGAQGLYRPRGATIITFPQDDPAVIRHEVAHHFAVALVGELSPALNEGIAEVLEGVTWIGGRVHVPVVSPEHLERLLETGVVELTSNPSHRHSHVDYAGAWALVAFALERETGTLRERLLAMASRSEVKPPTAGELLAAAERWKPELGSIVLNGEVRGRAAAARLLGRLGEVKALRTAFATERVVSPALAIAGALARHGEKAPLRSLIAFVACHLLREVSRSVGREFETVEALKVWLER